MKKLLTFLIAILMTTSLFAQSPEKIGYQAVLRDSSNTLISNTTVGMQISILQNSASGNAIYVETQTPTTNENGLISIEIGSGTPVIGTFSNIVWSDNTHFIKMETDPYGGTSYTISGTSQLLSVPYALHAETTTYANSAKTAENVNNSDTSKTNEIQNLSVSLSGDTLYLSAGNYVIIPGISSANTIQVPKVTDYEGNEYRIITIGNQTWMAENLRSIVYSNGDSILNGAGTGHPNEDVDLSYYFTYNDDQYGYNDSVFGKLYTWAAAMNGATSNDAQGICPTGWHIPSDNDWKELEENLGMTQYDRDRNGWRGTDEGDRLKSIDNWTTGSTGTGDSGFDAIGSGYRNTTGVYTSLGTHTYFFSSTQQSATRVWNRGFYYTNPEVYRNISYKWNGNSVRCVKD